MPELPEVKIIADILSNELVGKTLLKITPNENSRFYIKGIEGKEYLKNESYKIKEVVTYGKKIFIKMSEGLILFSFLGLTGYWHFDDNSKHLKITLEFEDKKIYFSDVRNFGTFKILKKEDIPNILKDTGVDYFSKKMSFELFKEKITNKKIEDKIICLFFQEQKHLSGIGSYINMEVLYRAKISPYRQLKTLSGRDLKKLYNSILYVMITSYNAGGHSFSDYLNPYNKKGGFIPEIYGKKNEKDKNGFYIKYEKIDVLKKGFYWVSEIQK